jgi:hypothetical protein
MIKPIEVTDITEHILEAKKEGLIFSHSTRLYGYFVNNKIVGFTGIVLYKNKAVFKNHYVLKKHRNKGYFKKMFAYSINLCKFLNVNTIEATCTEMSINYYLNNNFIPIKKYRLFTKVRNENIRKENSTGSGN